MEKGLPSALGDAGEVGKDAGRELVVETLLCKLQALEAKVEETISDRVISDSACMDFLVELPTCISACIFGPSACKLRVRSVDAALTCLID